MNGRAHKPSASAAALLRLVKPAGEARTSPAEIASAEGFGALLDRLESWLRAGDPLPEGVESAAREFVAMLEIAKSGNTRDRESASRLLCNAAKAMKPSAARAIRIRRALEATRALIEERGGFGPVELRGRLASITGEPAFQGLEPARIKAAMQRCLITTGQRGKNAYGKSDGVPAFLAELCCACGAFGFKADQRARARREISRKVNLHN